MLSGLFKAKPVLTRFESTEAFKQPAIILNKLREKKCELKQDAEKSGPGSIDYRKYLVVNDLIEQFDKVINDFNECKITSDAEEIMEIIKASKQILEIISIVRKTEDLTLMTARNKQRENVSNAVYYGTFGTTFIAGSALSVGTLGKLLSLVYIAPSASKSIHEATGLNDLSPTSARLLNQLTQLLDNLVANLSKQTHIEIEIKASDTEDFTCPITQDIIHDPVVCTLDGHAYEKEAIEEWFQRKRTSPINPDAEIPPNRSPKDFLIKHYNYTSLLEKYKRDHPTIAHTNPSL